MTSASGSSMMTTTTVATTDTTPAPIVVVSLAIPLLPPEKLYPTPSLLDGLPYEVEFDLRLTGCELIQTAGRLLKLPQVTRLTNGHRIDHRIQNMTSRFSLSDCHGQRSDSLSPLLLHQIVRQVQYGAPRHGGHLPEQQGPGVSATHS